MIDDKNYEIKGTRCKRAPVMGVEGDIVSGKSEFKFSDQFRNTKSNGKTVDARITGWTQRGYKVYTEEKGVTPKNIVTINQYNNQLYTKPL